MMSNTGAIPKKKRDRLPRQIPSHTCDSRDIVEFPLTSQNDPVVYANISGRIHRSQSDPDLRRASAHNTTPSNSLSSHSHSEDDLIQTRSRTAKRNVSFRFLTEFRKPRKTKGIKRKSIHLEPSDTSQPTDFLSAEDSDGDQDCQGARALKLKETALYKARKFFLGASHLASTFRFDSSPGDQTSKTLRVPSTPITASTPVRVVKFESSPGPNRRIITRVLEDQQHYTIPFSHSVTEIHDNCSAVVASSHGTSGHRPSSLSARHISKSPAQTTNQPSQPGTHGTTSSPQSTPAANNISHREPLQLQRSTSASCPPTVHRSLPITRTSNATYSNAPRLPIRSRSFGRSPAVTSRSDDSRRARSLESRHIASDRQPSTTNQPAHHSTIERSDEPHQNSRNHQEARGTDPSVQGSTAHPTATAHSQDRDPISGVPAIPGRHYTRGTGLVVNSTPIHCGVRFTAPTSPQVAEPSPGHRSGSQRACQGNGTPVPTTAAHVRNPPTGKEPPGSLPTFRPNRISSGQRIAPTAKRPTFRTNRANTHKRDKASKWWHKFLSKPYNPKSPRYPPSESSSDSDQHPEDNAIFNRCYPSATPSNMATASCSTRSRRQLVEALINTGLYNDYEAEQRADDIIEGRQDVYDEDDDVQTTEDAIKKLLTNQQALTMLASIPNFSGESITRFDRWICQFDNLADLAKWSDKDKIIMLTSKLSDKACVALDDFKTSYPERAKSYEEIKEALKKRFHGGETENFFKKKLDNCKRKPHESVIEFSYRLKEIFNHVYPPLSGKNAEATELRTKLLKDCFLNGLEDALHERVKFKKFKTFEDLVELTNKYAASYDEKKESKAKKEFIDSITPSINELTEVMKALLPHHQRRPRHFPAQEDSSTHGLSANVKELSDLARSLHRPSHSINAINASAYDQRPHHMSSNMDQNKRLLLEILHTLKGGQPRARTPFQPQGQRQYNPSYRSNQYDGICGFCRIRGHHESNCRKKMCQQGRRPQQPICYICQQQGHFARQCPRSTNRVSVRSGGSFSNQRSSRVQGNI